LLIYRPGKFPLAIVLAPTRELAKQVEREFLDSSPLETLCVYGGTPIMQQIKQLNYGVDVVIGTPGRVIDLLKRGALSLAEIRFVVLDEADQMLSVGFDKDVETILERVPPQHQTLMFSATMPTWIRKLTQKFLNSPVTVDLVSATSSVTSVHTHLLLDFVTLTSMNKMWNHFWTCLCCILCIILLLV
jgi:superfamily II DNA/RNA helicase